MGRVLRTFSTSGMAAVTYITTPSTIKLEAQAASSAAKEDQAKRDLLKSDIQHKRELNKEEDAKKKAEREKLDLEGRNERLRETCHSINHERMTKELDNKQLQSNVDNVSFQLEVEKNAFYREKEEIKRESERQKSSMKLGYGKKIDEDKLRMKENQQEFENKLQMKSNEISKLNETVQEKVNELQGTKLEHQRSIKEATETLQNVAEQNMNYTKKKHAEELNGRALEIEKLQSSEDTLKRRNADMMSDNEEQLRNQHSELTEMHDKLIIAIRREANERIDNSETEKNELQRKYRAQLMDLQKDHDLIRRKDTDKYDSELTKLKNEHELRTNDFEIKIEKGHSKIKELEGLYIQQEKENKLKLERNVMEKETEMRNLMDATVKKRENLLASNFDLEKQNLIERFEFKIARKQRENDSLSEEFKREKDRGHCLGDNLKRTERQLKEEKHKEEMERQKLMHQIAMLEKKLNHEEDLRKRDLLHFRSPFPSSKDSGLYPEDCGDDL